MSMSSTMRILCEQSTQKMAIKRANHQVNVDKISTASMVTLKWFCSITTATRELENLNSKIKEFYELNQIHNLLPSDQHLLQPTLSTLFRLKRNEKLKLAWLESLETAIVKRDQFFCYFWYVMSIIHWDGYNAIW